VLLDRKRVKFWQKWVFAFMAVIMAGFLIMIPVSGNMGCSGTSSASDQITKDIAKYEAAVKTDPKNVEAWRTLGDSYVLRANQQAQGSDAQKADWRMAALDYRRAARLLAKQKGATTRQLRLDTFKQLVSVYLYLQDYQQASGVYSQITALTPKDAQAYFDWATIAINAGDTNTALLAFGKFLELDPTSPDAPAVKTWIKENSSKKTPAPGSTQGASP
jgi:tetratricopeptide (TPR) repeat protein